MAAAATEYRCFVGGLAWSTSDQGLEDAFSPFGELIECKVINHRETGKSRGFGFVTFSNEQSMIDAIEGMNGKDLDGRSISVHPAHTRSGSGGGANGGSGFRGSNGSGGNYAGGSRFNNDRESGYGRRSNDTGYGGGSGRDRSYGGGYGEGARRANNGDGGGGSNFGWNNRYGGSGGAGPDSGSWRK
ncbi:hypothetical protein KP509_30G070400 [Ceratopteris richardii]|uniref:RRM domain-containing protein n=1 Tax=Ceratopteris richardii TaxID=49495 RepID=A0A8T2R5S6_CERRI|nr:hypothetical protein KP509_30G070400 [Ceratopteris richardii]